MSHPTRPRLEALTGLRFFAALHVVMFHMYGRAGWSLPRVLANVLSTGYVAVTFFFTLSGFILTYTYFGRRASSAIELRGFYSARVARIYPVYLLALLVCAPALRLLGGNSQVGSLWGALATVPTLTQAYFPTFALLWNPPAWSLSAEAFFYLIFPFTAAYLTACSKPKAIALATIAWGAGLALAGLYIVVAPDGLAQVTHDTSGYWLNVLKYHPLVRCPDFLVGIVLGRLYLERAPGAATPTRALRVAGASAAIAVACVLAASEHVPFPLLHNGLLTPAFALVIYVLAVDHGSFVSRALSAAWLTMLGEASYSLYILHDGVFRLIRRVGTIATHTELAFGTATGLLAVALAVGASIAAWRFVEVPMRGRVRGWLERPATAAPVLKK